jgi:hypothetical protein
MKWVVIFAFGMLMFASGQIVSQKLLASDEAGSFLEDADLDKACRWSGCDFALKGNGVCDQSCIAWQCGYDGGDCDKFADCYKKGCNAGDLGNGRCDYSCNNYQCEYDKGDCRYY